MPITDSQSKPYPAQNTLHPDPDSDSKQSARVIANSHRTQRSITAFSFNPDLPMAIT